MASIEKLKEIIEGDLDIFKDSDFTEGMLVYATRKLFEDKYGSFEGALKYGDLLYQLFLSPDNSLSVPLIVTKRSENGFIVTHENGLCTEIHLEGVVYF